MPTRKRKRRERTHEWQEIQQADALARTRGQYERLRPIVSCLARRQPSAPKKSGVSERTLHRPSQTDLKQLKAWSSLFHKVPSLPASTESVSRLRYRRCGRLIVNLKAEYPGFSTPRACHDLFSAL